jgi:23S rRNA (pseudouridine1915-N3)-methyltransferase
VKIDVVTIGRLKAGPERELCLRYAERFRAIGRGLGLDGPRLSEISESPARREDDRKVEEFAGLDAAIPAGFRRVIFDEKGNPADSAAFAAFLERYRMDGAPGIAFVIGGPDGLNAEIAARADLMISFGRMTMPHQLVRVLVLEQLYRAATILAGHPYHRA